MKDNIVEQEPVGWLVSDRADGHFFIGAWENIDVYSRQGHAMQPLYAAPVAAPVQENTADQIEKVAVLLWQRFSPPHVENWEEETHKAEYRLAAQAALSHVQAPAELVDVEGSPLLEWAISKWNAEVKHRPLVNVHRRSLDDAWRQVIRWAGGDPSALVGPSHDELLANMKGKKS